MSDGGLGLGANVSGEQTKDPLITSPYKEPHRYKFDSFILISFAL